MLHIYVYIDTDPEPHRERAATNQHYQHRELADMLHNLFTGIPVHIPVHKHTPNRDWGDMDYLYTKISMTPWTCWLGVYVQARSKALCRQAPPYSHQLSCG
jgi:hypothetical protein